MRTLLWIIAISLAAFAAVQLGGPEAIREQLGRWAPFLTLPAHTAAVAGPLAGDELFGLANGTLYGLWLGSFLSWVAWFSGSLIQFYVGRRARLDFDVPRALERAPKWIQKLPFHHPLYIIGVRFLVPGVGGHLATVVPGAVGVNWRRFLWATAIGILPPSIGWTYAGVLALSAA